ncbi:Zinc finger, RING-type [Dillenia turbinata]|uniref:Zinc finger, RING-type n=1 Tax=Dillenia turbinata TaxID=194707 RepID=A0AAN8Z0K8_9MAGN
MSLSSNGTTNTFSKTICTICYEDLKPIVEDLQSISICGHVFHELCLQQWFEYSANKKKSSCPVCKQSCTAKGAHRLYFQSIGDGSDAVLVTQKPIDCEEDPEKLRREVKKLESKLLGVTTALERQETSYKEVSEELCLCKEQIKKEAELKNEALRQIAISQQLIRSKSEVCCSLRDDLSNAIRTKALDRSTIECSRLQERNMALAKELAALKLVSDLNLDEDEVLKLASLGHEANSKDTVDILKRSLVIRNQSYKELMAKCNLLGRGEARFAKKHEKAKEKIHKLKTRIQELETSIEAKENEVLRALKASNKIKFKRQKEKAKPIDDQGVKKAEDVTTISVDDHSSSEKAQHVPKDVDGCQNPYGKTPAEVSLIEDVDLCKPNASKMETAFGASRETSVHELKIEDEFTFSRMVTSNGMRDSHSSALDESMMLPLDDIRKVQPLLNIRKETPSPAPLAQPGDQCFAGGLLGPDGTSRYLGKWCKRVQSNVAMGSSLGIQESKSQSSSLIAVGADGRGGRVKVLRSLNDSVLVESGWVGIA